MQEIVGKRTPSASSETINELDDGLITAEKAVLEEKDLEKSYDEVYRDLITFIEKQTDLMNKNIKLSGEDGTPQFADLNECLMDYESVMLGLNGLHGTTRLDYAVAKEKYETFWDEKYYECKLEQVNLGKSGFSNIKDVEVYTRRKYKDELAALKAEVIRCENKYNFANSLVDSWKNYQYVLTTLSANARAEAAAFKLGQNNQKEFEDDGVM